MVTYRNSSSQAAISQRRWKVPGLSQRILTKQLRDLEGAGLVERELFETVPLRVACSPTTLGRTLRSIYRQLRDWAAGRWPDITKAQRRHDRGRKVALAGKRGGAQG